VRPHSVLGCWRLQQPVLNVFIHHRDLESPLERVDCDSRIVDGTISVGIEDCQCLPKRMYWSDAVMSQASESA
jgi:hypothetical protein